MRLLYENLSVAEATVIQNSLKDKVDVAERALRVNAIAGADISLNLYSTILYAGIMLLSFPELQPLAYSLVKAETRFPYVPGYLAFREVPALLIAWEQMGRKPDVLVADGHGIAHPRRMGIAAHFGALSGQRSMGCAKSILSGKYAEPDTEQGAFSPIMDKDETIGFAFRSKRKTLPVYVSPGHLMGLQNSLDLIKQCCGKYRIPEPTRLAHELVNRFRKNELPEGYHEL